MRSSVFGLKKSAPFVRRQRRRTDADARARSNVKRRAVDARPWRRLVGARHVGRAGAENFQSEQHCRRFWSLTRMRFALAMHERTALAVVAIATSLSSDARAAAAYVSACISSKSARRPRRAATPARSSANWSIMSTTRTTESPQTRKLSAHSPQAGVAPLAQRLLAAARRQAPPSTDTLTSTTGSSVCGLSYSSGAAGSAPVASPRRKDGGRRRRAAP